MNMPDDIYGTPVDRERGFRAMCALVADELDEARKRLPKRTTEKMVRSAAFRSGYYEGLLAAHCWSALGFYPLHPLNTEQIQKTLTKPKDAKL